MFAADERRKLLIAAKCCGPATLHRRSEDAAHNELATGIAAAPDAIPTTCHEQHGFQPDPVPAGVMEAIKADGAEQDRRNAAKSSTVYVALNTCASGDIPPRRFSTLADAQDVIDPRDVPPSAKCAALAFAAIDRAMHLPPLVALGPDSTDRTAEFRGSTNGGAA